MKPMFNESTKRRLLTSALASTHLTLSELLEHYPEGLSSMLSLWRLLSMDYSDPAFEQTMDAALESIDLADVLDQALWLGRAGPIRSLVERDIPIGRLLHPDTCQEKQWEVKDGAKQQDEFGPISANDETYQIARMAALTRRGLSPIGLHELSRLSPDRPGCTMTPASVDDTTSWLALALFVGKFDDAEKIWHDRLDAGGEWSVVERAEASLAWWSSAESWGGMNHAPSSWWERLMAPGVALEPVRVRQGWAEMFRSDSHTRFQNLKYHAESALVQAENGDSADMLGLLLKTLQLTSGPMETVRPVDIAINGLASVSPEHLGEDKEKFMSKVAAFDWASVPPDAQDRPLAMVALDRGRAADSHMRGNTRCLDTLWIPLVKALRQEDQDIWWSLATSLAISGYVSPMKVSVSIFKGRFGLAVGQALAMEAGGAAERGERVNDGRCTKVIRRFWQEIVPCITHTSTPEVALHWEERRKEMSTRLGGLDMRKSGGEEELLAMIMDLRSPLPQIKKSPKTRL